MEDQAPGAVDPLDAAASLIANSADESGDIEDDDEEQVEASETEAEDSEDATDKESATEAPREVLFAGQKFTLPEGLPPEVIAQVEEVGKNLQGDYTRKTQELVSREKQAAEIVQRNLNEGRQQVQQAIYQAHAVIQAVGGLMDPTQLAQLASEDPTAYVQHQARQQQLQAYLGNLQQQAQMVEQQAQAVAAQRAEIAKQESWQRLNAEGIDTAGLQKLWNEAKQSYSFLNDERLSQVIDAESWLVLRDAIAYRQLKAKAPTVTKAAKEAPKLPEAKQPMPKEVRAKLDARKAVTRRGGASMRDLAAFIATNN